MANLKSTTIDDTGFLQLPSGTTAQRPQSPTAGEIRFNTDTKVCEWYDDQLDSWFPTGVVPPVATGGDTVEDVDIDGVTYRIHSFTTVGSSDFTITRGGSVDYLIVAGGGSGQDRHGGAGGAGGVLLGITTVSSGLHTITVGAGGTHNGQTGNQQDIGENGSNSSAFHLTAIGGGRGGHWNPDQGVPGFPGGSGGAAPRFRDNVSQPGGQGTPGQGNNGASPTGPTERYVPGGGGAGSPGQTNTQLRPGDGGTGVSSSISSTTQFYAGGGGGGAYLPPENNFAQGGLGGGGCYTQQPLTTSQVDAESNTGGGGGAAYYPSGGGDNRGGSGGSGIVIIRYRIS